MDTERYYKVRGFRFSDTPLYSWNFVPVQVKWTRVPDLVERRRVLLKAGFAYVPSREISSIAFQEFQTNLTKALEVSDSSSMVRFA